tara:strand:- start:270 stop:593 length:324 start_codon:yes stop_codon:yes gene_type:complete
MAILGRDFRPVDQHGNPKPTRQQEAKGREYAQELAKAGRNALTLIKVDGKTCPNCKTHGPFEIRDNRFERVLFSTGYLPASCTLCGATWEMHYTLSSIENLQLDEGE